MPSYGPNNIIISSKPLLINHYESIRVGNNEKVTFTGVIDQSNTTVQIKSLADSLPTEIVSAKILFHFNDVIPKLF